MPINMIHFIDIFTGLIFMRIYLIISIFMGIFIIQSLSPESLKRKFSLLNRKRSQEFILLILMHIIYSLYASIYERGIEYQTDSIAAKVLQIIAMKQMKKSRQKIQLSPNINIQLINIPFTKFPLEHQVLQFVFSLFLLYTYILIVKHKPINAKTQIEKLMKERIKVDPTELSKEEYEQYGRQLQNELMKLNYPITHKLRQQYMPILEFECQDCGIPTIFSDHSYVTDQCLFHNDHYCPWTGQDIYLNNTANFFVFLCALFIQSSFGLYRHCFYFYQLRNTIINSVNMDNFRLGFIQSITVLLFNANDTIQQLIFELIVNAIAIIPAIIQIIFFTRKLFFVFSLPDRDQLQFQLKRCMKNQLRLIFNDNFMMSEVVKKNNEDVYQIKQVKTGVYIYYQNSHNIAPQQRLLTKFVKGKVTESFTQKESCTILARLRNKMSLAMCREYFGYLTLS